jgi:hypothetical protein
VEERKRNIFKRKIREALEDWYSFVLEKNDIP